MLFIHNPRCSKSRALKEQLDLSGISYETREYLKQPLSERELFDLLAKLEGQSAELIRVKEPEFKQSPVDLNDQQAIIRAIVKYPQLLERPILIGPNRARIGRPIEHALELLNSDE